MSSTQSEAEPSSTEDPKVTSSSVEGNSEPSNGKKQNLEPPRDNKSLSKRAVSGVMLMVSGYGASQALRFGSNLILTRLLFPEAFGLMAIVNIFLQGLKMFSDVGINQAIVQHKKGAEEIFLNTAWTVQVVRGVIIAIAMCVISWPVAEFYDEPELMWLLPVVGANSILTSLASVSLAVLNRRLVLGREVFIDLGSQVVGITSMIGIAWVWPSVWALPLGSTFGALVFLVLSHKALPGHRHRFAWDPESRKDLFNFGKWITLSTAFSFIALQADRMILSTIATMTLIGVYSVASGLTQVVSTLCGKLSYSILFPLLAEWGRQGPERLRLEVRRVRIRILGLLMLAPCGLVVMGDFMIRVLYDDRYLDAGWMVSLLGVGLVPQLLGLSIEPVMLATGDSYRHMSFTIGRASVSVLAMGIGAYGWGVEGLLIGNVVANFIHYLLLVPGLRSKNVWMPVIDLTALASCALLIVLGRMLANSLGL